METPVKLTKADARRALVRHHFTPCATQQDVFNRLRSIQFDPIAPVGCNHDLVLQARVPGYKIGDWNKTAYEEKFIYDGWDKQASLVPYDGWPLRRIFHTFHRKWFEQRIFQDHKEAVELILKEIAERGPMMPRDFEFQQRRDEWKVSWHGPSVTKQTLRALWHSGLVMTAGRKNGQHLYDLTERVVPPHLLNQRPVDDQDAIRELILERHRAMGILRPTAPPEVWSLEVLTPGRKPALSALLARNEIVPVELEGVKAHATPEFLNLLDLPSLKERVVFVAPLDPFLWDRKMVAHIFDFNYVWEIYTAVSKRRWGYYVLPVLYGDRLVARAEFWCRDGILELREWHFEPGEVNSRFWAELEIAVRKFMQYGSAQTATVKPHIEPKVRDAFLQIRL